MKNFLSLISLILFSLVSQEQVSNLPLLIVFLILIFLSLKSIHSFPKGNPES